MAVLLYTKNMMMEMIMVFKSTVVKKQNVNMKYSNMHINILVHLDVCSSGHTVLLRLHRWVLRDPSAHTSPETDRPT